MLKYNAIILICLSFLFSQETDQIFFPHDFHIEDMELECSDCHLDVRQSESLKDRLLPDKDVCLSCHDGDTAGDDCELCHTNPDKPLPYPKLSVRTGPSFSHKQHLVKFEDCLSCHSGQESNDGTSPGFIWKEKDCQACHDYQKPKSHIASWKNVHGLVMNDYLEDNCSFCHNNNFCDNCHQYQQFTLNIHNSDYLSIHGLEASSGVLECSTCHSREDDCTSCHKKQNVMPLNHSFPNWAGVYLPNGGEHGASAIDAADVCQVCHESSGDPTCLRCHGETK
jgi:hypothetical protein